MPSVNSTRSVRQQHPENIPTPSHIATSSNRQKNPTSMRWLSRPQRAHIFVSWLHPYKEQRLVVMGRKQLTVFEDTHPERELVLFDERVEWHNGQIQVGNPHGALVRVEPLEPLRQECEHFLECVATRRRPNTPGEEGLAVLQVLEVSQRSQQMSGDLVQVQSST